MFYEKIKYLSIDKAYHHYTWGIKQCGKDAFSRAWGKLDSIRLCLMKGTPCLAISGTFPPHVQLLTAQHLLFKPGLYDVYNLPLSRANITYIVLPLIGGIKNHFNL
jgi:hypothetical protein